MWDQVADFNTTVVQAETDADKRAAYVVLPDNSNQGGAVSVVNRLDYGDRPW